MSILIAAAAMLAAVCISVPAEAIVNQATLLRELHDMGKLPILTDTKCRQFSSYNPGEPFEKDNRIYYPLNVDRAHFLSMSEDGEAVLADMQGPGAIVRIWSANAAGTLKIYLDGANEPVINMPFREFFTDPEQHPLRTTSSGGFISYYPIPYQKSCKVVVQDPGSLFYHVTYQTYPPGTKVTTYTPERDEDTLHELDTLLEVWRDPSEFRSTSFPHALGPVKLQTTDHKKVSIAPGDTSTVFSAEGAGCIDELSLSLDQQNPRLLRQAIIRMYWDGEESPSVEAPLSDFFANGFEPTRYLSLPLGVTEEHFYCRFPMPFGSAARIDIENGSKRALDLEVSVKHRVLDSLAQRVGRFHAKWREEITVEGVPYLVLHAKGRGKLVGCSMTMQGHLNDPERPDQTRFRYLEGDELIWVDGEREASFYGTGAEDYFNCAYYFSTGAVAQPIHGAPYFDDILFSLGAYRLHVPDYVNYENELYFEIEHGGHRGFCNYPDAEYASVAYYYNLEPHFEFFKMPPANSLWIPRVPIPPDLHGAIEAESLNPQATNAETEILPWEKISREARGGQVVVLTPSNQEAALTLPFEVASRDRYTISAYLVEGAGFGGVTAALNGKPLGSSPDISSANEPMPAEPAALGEVVLEPGSHTLELRPAASGGAMPKIGLDRIAVTSASPFIGDWSIIGPFDSDKDDRLEAVFPPEIEEFNPSSSYLGKDGAMLTWRRVETPGMMNLAKLINPNQRVVAYALTHVTSPDERQTELLLGAENMIKIWLNGEEIWQQPTLRRGVFQDHDSIPLTLKPGANTLLLKIAQVRGGWGFIARVRDPDGVLKYSATRP